MAQIERHVLADHLDGHGWRTGRIVRVKLAEGHPVGVVSRTVPDLHVIADGDDLVLVVQLEPRDLRTLLGRRVARPSIAGPDLKAERVFVGGFDAPLLVAVLDLVSIPVDDDLGVVAGVERRDRHVATSKNAVARDESTSCWPRFLPNEAYTAASHHPRPDAGAIEPHWLADDLRNATVIYSGGPDVLP